MIIAKNLRLLRKAHTCGGRSRSSQLMCQSSSMRQSSSTGPAMNASSSRDSDAFGMPKASPIGSAAEQIGVPPNVTGFDRLALGIGQARAARAAPTQKSGG